MKLFQTEIMICASLYILADSQEEAQTKANEFSRAQHALEFSNRRQEIGDGITMTGETFSKDMPELSLSPAMTVQESGTRLFVYESEDFDRDDDENILCGQCEGTGEIAGGLSGDGDDEECPVCDGSGSIPVE